MSEHPNAKVGEMNKEDSAGHPVSIGRFNHPTEGGSNQDWWPNQLNLKILRKHGDASNPMPRRANSKNTFTAGNWSSICRRTAAASSTPQATR